MHHIWFLTIAHRDEDWGHGYLPYHQPLDHPHPWRWLIWAGGYLSGGWSGIYWRRGRLYLPNIHFFPAPSPRFTGWKQRRAWIRRQIPTPLIERRTPCPYSPSDHFDWVLNAYLAPEITPITENDIPF